MRLTALLLLVVLASARADIYKSIDANGEVVYSDQTGPGAERVIMPPLPSYTPHPQRSIKRTTAIDNQQYEQQFYESFALTSPANEATIRNNLGTVVIETVLTPALMTPLGHGVRFYVDGVAHGALTDDTTVTLTNIDRGEHRLSASIVDAAGEVLMATDEVTVYVKRASKLHGNKQGSVTDNPGNITSNPNIVGDETFQPYQNQDIADFSATATDDVDESLAEQPANPGFRNRNPNILSPNPNFLSPNPNLINPPQPKED